MAEIGEIAMRCVALSGLRDSYFAMICTRGRPRIFGSRRPQDCDNKLIVYAIPWIDVIPIDAGAMRGTDAICRCAPLSCTSIG
ncbi:hypothetical protein ACC728_37965, partial [Rhizobium ruizarguesonis]